MAWIYLAELEESHLHSANGCEQSPIVNVTDTLKVCCCRECFLETSTEHQSGTTLHRLSQPCYQVSTLSSEGFPAKTLAVQEMERAWRESEADYSLKLSDSQKKLTRRLCSLKTFQQLELEDFEKSSEHLPKSGMTVAGRVYLPQALELHTKEKDGSYLRTPTHADWKNMGCSNQLYLTDQVRPHQVTNKQKLKTKELWVLYPPPTASTAKTNGKQKCQKTGKWINGKPSLETMARQNLWPTVTARDWKSGSKGKQKNSRPLSEEVGGQLNPTWVEWLMGYPLEWTELSVWAILWFRPKREKRSKDCVG